MRFCTMSYLFTQIEFDGGAEHNLSFTVPSSSSNDSTIRIASSNMTSPEYEVCLDWNSTANTCEADDTTRIGWQWNHVALVFNSTTGKIQYVGNHFQKSISLT